MKIIDCKQGSTEWLMARAGVFTASEFDNLMTPEFKPRTGETPKTYIFRKIAEKFMGVPMMDGGGSWAMEQGSILENEALPWFEFTHGIKVERVGLVTTDDGRCGASPDGLIGDVGGIEIKCPRPDTHIKYLVGGCMPKEYLAQVHGSMYVTGRPWWMFLSYSRQFPALVLKVERDERIMAAIRSALDGARVVFDEIASIIHALKIADEAPARARHEAEVRAFEETGVAPT